MYDYALREDPNLTVAGISAYEDIVIGALFLELFDLFQLTGGWPPVSVFNVNRYRDAMSGAVAEVSAAHPGRFETYQYEGYTHVVTTSGDPGDVLDAVQLLLPIFGISNPIGINAYDLDRGGVRMMDWLQAMLDESDDFVTVME